MTLTRPHVPIVGVAAAALTAVALAAANFTGDGDNGGAGPYAFTLALSLVVALVVFGWTIPRTDRPARTGVIVGAIGVLSLAAFWLGLPYVLGPAAIVLGFLGRTQPDGRTPGTVAVALGGLATIGGIAALVLDQAL